MAEPEPNIRAVLEGVNINQLVDDIHKFSESVDFHDYTKFDSITRKRYNSDIREVIKFYKQALSEIKHYRSKENAVEDFKRRKFEC